MAVDQLAALVRAVALLRTPGPVDGELIEALVRLIAPPPPPSPAGARRVRSDPAPPAPSVTVSTEALPGSSGALKPRSRMADDDDGEPTAKPRPRAHDPEHLVARPSLLERLTERADLAAPRGGGGAGDTRDTRAVTESQASAPLESLFAPGRVRGILRELATLSTPSGQPDLAAAIRLIARAEPIEALPPLSVSTLGHSVQLLFDAGPAMLPFARDKQQLAATATRLLGKDRVRVADFIAHPLQGVRPQRQVRWQPLHWPGRRSSVVVISDLGIGEGDLGAQLQADAWQRFLDEARRRGLRSVVLIPYARERWPAVAESFGTALTWDLATGVQALRQSMRARPRG